MACYPGNVDVASVGDGAGQCCKAVSVRGGRAGGSLKRLEHLSRKVLLSWEIASRWLEGTSPAYTFLTELHYLAAPLTQMQRSSSRPALQRQTADIHQYALLITLTDKSFSPHRFLNLNRFKALMLPSHTSREVASRVR